MAGEVTIQEEQQETVIPLSAVLETPNEPEEDESVEVTVEDKVESAEKVVEEKIEDAKKDGATRDELNELRGLLRDLRNDNISLKSRLAAAERIQKGEFGTDGKETETTEIEKYTEQLQQASQRDFSQLLAVMEVNPKYEDLSEVCSTNNFEDIFERVAQYNSTKNGTDFSTELVKVRAEVWSLPNPYKYMYETIKEYHPKYKVVEQKQDNKKVSTKSAKEIIADKKVVTAPGSVANFGGGDETKGGWTAEKIDSMPENLLHTVPKDIYKKWLSGELD